jgi:tetratricopeptide (TPR) repeat protein/roadblock/LC7 domain-containing protein
MGTRAVCFHPDGRTLASGLWDGYVEFQSVSDGRIVRRIKASDGAVAAVNFNGDGRLLATGSNLREVAVWNVLDGRRVALFEGHTDQVKAVAFSPDGKRLASCGDENDKTIFLWDIATGRKVHRLVGHDGAVQCVQFSHDGKQIFSGSVDEMIRTWDVESGATVHVHRAHAGTTFGLALSPDGRRLASCSIDQSVKIWDVSTWQELQTLNTKGGHLESVAFSPDGSRLASGGTLRHVILWDSRPLTDELRVELAAADRVESLFAEHMLPKNVIRALKDEPVISDALRKKSLEMAERWHVDPDGLNDRSWSIVKQSGLPADQYQLAMRYAQAACELAPENGALRNTLGVAQYRTGDWKAAIAALEKSMELSDNSGGEEVDWFFIGMCRWQQGDKKLAKKWYDAARMRTTTWMAGNEGANQLKGEILRFQTEAATLLGLPKSAPPNDADDLAAANALVDIAPKANSYQLRGGIHADRRDWDKAAEDFAKAVELGEKTFQPWYLKALIKRSQNDKPAYQAACAAIIKQFSKADDAQTAHFLAWTCAVGPDALTDFAPAIALAEKAIKVDANSAQFANSLGAILYRAGRFDEARQKLEETNRLASSGEQRASTPAYTWYFLAMTHHRLGHADEAKKWFDKAREETEKALKEHDTGAATLAWNRRLTLNLLRNEAEALLGMKPAPAESAAVIPTQGDAPVEAKKP